MGNCSGGSGCSGRSCNGLSGCSGSVGKTCCGVGGGGLCRGGMAGVVTGSSSVKPCWRWNSRSQLSAASLLTSSVRRRWASVAAFMTVGFMVCGGTSLGVCGVVAGVCAGCLCCLGGCRIGGSSRSGRSGGRTPLRSCCGRFCGSRSGCSSGFRSAAGPAGHVFRTSKSSSTVSGLSPRRERVSASAPGSASALWAITLASGLPLAPLCKRVPSPSRSPRSSW